MFAEISLPISSFQTFTYLVPENLKKSLLVGSRVKVPLGARKVSGVVVSLIEESAFAGNLKSIIEVDDNTLVLSKELWKLINWISHYYVTPIGLAYNTVLPFSLLSNHSPKQSSLLVTICWPNLIEPPLVPHKSPPRTLFNAFAFVDYKV